MNWSRASNLVVIGVVGTACSTAADPPPDAPPVCEFCGVGEQELKCATAIYIDGEQSGYLGEAMYVCLEPTATDQEKEDACLASCQQAILDSELGEECNFKPGVEPFFWVGCVPPTATTSGGIEDGESCPGWYAPASVVTGFEQEGSVAAVSIELHFIEQLRADSLALYACDDARYVARDGGWEFEGIDPGDLLFELGIRNGDRNAVLEGFDPDKGWLTTSAYALDSLTGMHAAYEALRDADGVRVQLSRGADAEAWKVWVTLAR